jgi:predicted RNA-binding Zn-ribbon protein involved in translation (DUF1610 family)
MTAPTLEHRSGCALCGAELTYLPAAAPMACSLCGERRDSQARCQAGHFVCDACHQASAGDVIQRHCAHTDSRDPVEIALTLMRHPALNMHGPEHHFLVPAALVAAWCNATGQPERKAALVAEARKRAAPVLGGFCGMQGACGAAIGTGIFIALASGSTPLKGPQRCLSNRMTAKAMALVGGSEGARCCKRDSFLAVLSAVKYARATLGVAWQTRGPRCEFSALNGECGERDCPFYPASAAA